MLKRQQSSTRNSAVDKGKGEATASAPTPVVLPNILAQKSVRPQRPSPSFKAGSDFLDNPEAQKRLSTPDY